MMIRARLIELAVSIGYPSLQRMMHTVNAYAHATDEQLTDMQLQKLNVLLAHHMSRDPYRRYCEQAGVGRSCIRSLEDLREFPIVTKSFLRTSLSQIAALPEARRLDSTSGSSGQNLCFYHSRESLVAKSAAIRYCFALTGIEYWGNSQVTVWGFSPPSSLAHRLSHRVKLFLLNGQMLQGYGLDEATAVRYLKYLEDKCPSVLCGYPSYLYMLAQVGRTLDIPAHCPQVTISSGEQFLDQQRNIVESYFGANVYDRYGSREFGVIAHETPDHNGLYVPPTRFIVETDQSGELLITDLDNLATPFIRYAIGDLGQVASAYDRLGLHGQCISGIGGRIHDVLRTPSGRLIPGQFLTLLARAVPGIDEFQVVQRSTSHIIMRIKANLEYDQSRENELKEHFHAFFGDEVDLSISLVDEIERTAMGKRRFIIGMEECDGTP